MGLVQCSSNVSEGRRAEVIEAVVDAMAGAAPVHLLSVTPNPDHNRTVITFAGDAEACAEAAVAGALAAVRLIDLNQHRGSYPRMGACDVLPFIPLAGTTLAECVTLAHQVGERLAAESIPVYFYGAAARRSGRSTVAEVRGAGFEQLGERVAVTPEQEPDLGGPGLHPTAGAVAVGVRMPGVTLAVSLAGGASLAQVLSEPRALAPVMNLPAVVLQDLEPTGSGVQLVLTLADYRQTSLPTLLATLDQVAAALGARVAGSELLGEAPLEALLDVARHHLRLRSLQPAQVTEFRLLE